MAKKQLTLQDKVIAVNNIIVSDDTHTSAASIRKVLAIILNTAGEFTLDNIKSNICVYMGVTPTNRKSMNEFNDNPVTWLEYFLVMYKYADSIIDNTAFRQRAILMKSFVLAWTRHLDNAVIPLAFVTQTTLEPYYDRLANLLVYHRTNKGPAYSPTKANLKNLTTTFAGMRLIDPVNSLYSAFEKDLKEPTWEQLLNLFIQYANIWLLDDTENKNDRIILNTFMRLRYPESALKINNLVRLVENALEQDIGEYELFQSVTAIVKWYNDIDIDNNDNVLQRLIELNRSEVGLSIMDNEATLKEEVSVVDSSEPKHIHTEGDKTVDKREQLNEFIAQNNYRFTRESILSMLSICAEEKPYQAIVLRTYGEIDKLKKYANLTQLAYLLREHLKDHPVSAGRVTNAQDIMDRINEGLDIIIENLDNVDKYELSEDTESTDSVIDGEELETIEAPVDEPVEDPLESEDDVLDGFLVSQEGIVPIAMPKGTMSADIYKLYVYSQSTNIRLERNDFDAYLRLLKRLYDMRSAVYVPKSTYNDSNDLIKAIYASAILPVEKFSSLEKSVEDTVPTILNQGFTLDTILMAAMFLSAKTTSTFDQRFNLNDKYTASPQPDPVIESATAGIRETQEELPMTRQELDAFKSSIEERMKEVTDVINKLVAFVEPNGKTETPVPQTPVDEPQSLNTQYSEHVSKELDRLNLNVATRIDQLLRAKSDLLVSVNEMVEFARTNGRGTLVLPKVDLNISYHHTLLDTFKQEVESTTYPRGYFGYSDPVPKTTSSGLWDAPDYKYHPMGHGCSGTCNKLMSFEEFIQQNPTLHRTLSPNAFKQCYHQYINVAVNDGFTSVPGVKTYHPDMVRK